MPLIGTEACSQDLHLGGSLPPSFTCYPSPPILRPLIPFFPPPFPLIQLGSPRKRCNPSEANKLFLANFHLNPFTTTLEPYSNGPCVLHLLMAVDGWAVIFRTVRRGLAGPQRQPAHQAPPRCTKCNGPPINGHVPTSDYSTWY